MNLMAITLAVATASALADQITTRVDAGAAAGTLKVYTGAKPATAEDAATGTLLATFTLTDPAAAAAAAGVADWDFDPDLSATVAAAGTAGWFRIADSDANTVLDGEVGTTGGVEKELNFTDPTWSAGDTVLLTSGTTTEPTS